MTQSLPSPFQLQLHTPEVRVGGKLVGELALAKGTAGPDWARRLTIRAQGQVVYDDDGWRTRSLSGGPEFSMEWPPRGTSAIRFELSLPSDVLASYESKAFKVTWELVTTLSGDKREQQMSWSQPLLVERGRTTRPPEWSTPSVDHPSSVLHPSVMRPLEWLGCTGLLAVFGLIMPLGLLFGRETGEVSTTNTVVRIFFAVGLLLVGLMFAFTLFSKARSELAFSRATLVPMARSFPFGATARLRAFVDTRTTVSIKEAWLELDVSINQEKLRSTGKVPVQVPAQLPKGQNQFDVEILIPPDFPPNYEYAQRAICTLTLARQGKDDVCLKTDLKFTSEVLEEAA